MPVRVDVRLLTVPTFFMRVLVMLVVYMGVVVLHWLVDVCMLVPLGKVQSHTERHQRRRTPEDNRRLLTQHD